MTAYEEAMIHYIKSEISGSAVKFDQHLSEHELGQLYKISKHQDLSHIVGSTLIKNKVLQPKTDLYDEFQKKIMIALYRYEKSNYEFDEIVKFFEENQIRYYTAQSCDLVRTISRTIDANKLRY